jgi:hypothetical protein
MILNEEERTILKTVLIYHYRKDISGCGCGWAELGRSHAEHVINIFEESVEMQRSIKGE